MGFRGRQKNISCDLLGEGGSHGIVQVVGPASAGEIEQPERKGKSAHRTNMHRSGEGEENVSPGPCYLAGRARFLPSLTVVDAFYWGIVAGPRALNRKAMGKRRLSVLHLSFLNVGRGF